MLLIIIIVLILLFGGGGGYYGHTRWGPGGGFGIGPLLCKLAESSPEAH